MAGIVGLSYFDSDWYSQKQSCHNTSFHYDLVFLHYWDWILTDIGYHLFMIGHELQAFKICNEQELAGH
jgi:hypothetical protein